MVSVVVFEFSGMRCQPLRRALYFLEVSMNNIDFNNCRVFLERMIQEHPENKDFLQAYVKLIEKKTEFDISFFQGDAELRKDWEKNQTERIKADSEVAKTSIERGAPIPRKSGW